MEETTGCLQQGETCVSTVSHSNGGQPANSSNAVSAFEKEGALPPKDSVFLRCGVDHYQKNIPSSRALVIRGGDGLSVEWSRYATPEQTLLRNLKEGKTTADFRVASANVGEILNAKEMASGTHLFKQVVHDPIQHGEPFGPNQAHSLIVPVSSKAIYNKKTKEELKDREFEDDALAALKELFRPA